MHQNGEGHEKTIDLFGIIDKKSYIITYIFEIDIYISKYQFWLMNI